MTKSDRKCIVDEDTTSSPGEPATDWRSIYVASALSFVGAVQFSLYFSSLWPYLRIIDKGADEAFFGYIVAVYSLGQIISSPTFGWVSNKLKEVRLPMFVGLAMMLLGNMLYIALEFSGVAPRYLLLVGRFITGMGSGNVILLRTYASTASTYKDRHKAIAYVTCGQALGQTSGPAFQFLFTPLTYPGVQLFTGMSFNMYTAPAYFACAINIFGAMALYFLFRENYAGIIEDNPTDCDKNNNGSKFSPGLPMYDIFAVLVCNVTRFTQMFVQTNLET
ncbi:Protein F27D9.2 [Aphelenchoides avenae]|nr:Protein F27D9.2 [Aphelenchus avenae]